jgi:hypothetical protein
LKPIPSRVFTSCRPTDPLGPVPTPTRFFAPSTTFPGLAPVAAGSSLSRRGSAPRFSQPLSGFLAHPGFAALFHAAAARGVLPSEPCSSPGSRAPLGVAVLPCSSPPGVNSQGSNEAFSLRVSPTPAPHDAIAWLPTGARTPFPPRVRVRPHRLPRRPDPVRPPGLGRSGFGCFEALIPPRSRTAGAAEATFHGRCSPGLRPSRALLRSSLGTS